MAELADSLEADAVDGYFAEEGQPSTVVEPMPSATGITLEEIGTNHLDYLQPRGVLRGVTNLQSDRVSDAMIRSADRILEEIEDLWIVPADVHF